MTTEQIMSDAKQNDHRQEALDILLALAKDEKLSASERTAAAGTILHAPAR